VRVEGIEPPERDGTWVTAKPDSPTSAHPHDGGVAPAPGFEPGPGRLTAVCPASWATPDRLCAARTGLEPARVPGESRATLPIRPPRQVVLSCSSCSDGGGIRTHDFRLMRPMRTTELLYPVARRSRRSVRVLGWTRTSDLQVRNLVLSPLSYEDVPCCTCPRRDSNAQLRRPQRRASTFGPRGRGCPDRGRAAGGGFEPPMSGSEPDVLPGYTSLQGPGRGDGPPGRKNGAATGIRTRDLRHGTATL
jgi:hypothetical protein